MISSGAATLSGKMPTTRLQCRTSRFSSLRRMVESGAVDTTENKPPAPDGASLLKVIAMNSRNLGQSDLNITPIGIGAWAIGGGKWEFGWGAQDDQESIGALRAGLDLGINWIDTAAAYGLGH